MHHVCPEGKDVVFAGYHRAALGLITWWTFLTVSAQESKYLWKYKLIRKPSPTPKPSATAVPGTQQYWLRAGDQHLASCPHLWWRQLLLSPSGRNSLQQRGYLPPQPLLPWVIQMWQPCPTAPLHPLKGQAGPLPRHLSQVKLERKKSRV